MSEWLPARVELRQGCVMSTWLFNLYTRINDEGKEVGGMKMFSCRVMGMNVKKRLYKE